MKRLSLFTLIIFMLFSCKQQDNKTTSGTDVKVDTATQNTAVTIPEPKDLLKVQIECNTESVKEPVSQLEDRIKRLAKLENNYRVKELDEIPAKDASLSRAIDRINNLPSYKKKILVTNLPDLKNVVDKVTYSFVKGTVDHGGKMFARASIEEYLFKSEDCAIQFEKLIAQLQSFGHNSEEFGKAPYSIFRIDDKIYFVVSGGQYMIDFYKKIGATLQK